MQVESFTADISFDTKSVPQREITPPPQQTVSPPMPTTLERTPDLSGPDDVTLTEERPTISVKRTPERSEPAKGMGCAISVKLHYTCLGQKKNCVCGFPTNPILGMTTLIFFGGGSSNHKLDWFFF